MIKKLLSRLPHKTIGGECFAERGPLLIRYFLFRSRWFNIYLHEFLRSDADRHMHDHPWSFLTFLLSGYFEHVPAEWELGKRYGFVPRINPPLTGPIVIGRHGIIPDSSDLGYHCRIWRRRFSLLYRPATWKHWVEIPPGKTAWSIILVSPKSREWGFSTEKGWIPWTEYEKEFPERCD